MPSIKKILRSVLATSSLLLTACSVPKALNTPKKSEATSSTPPQASIKPEKRPLVPLKLSNSKQNKKALTSKPNLWEQDKIGEYCNEIDEKFKHYGWGRSLCKKFNWHHVRNSYLGRPLLWMAYGNEDKHKETPLDTTLILCGVHGDEITPIKFCFDILYHIENNIAAYQDRMIIIAPIVTPDSFFRSHPTRTNYRGVDVNRNFPTDDWDKNALSLWKSKYRSDKRRYPGKSSLSEAEVLFQVNLIKRYQPNKIISVHAPLTLLDYDGPGDEGQARDLGSQAVMAKQLLVQMSEKASYYRIKNYPYFPGSLGNWAGKERNIPTYTWELPTSDARNHKRYWKLFQEAIHLAIIRDIAPTSMALKNEE